MRERLVPHSAGMKFYINQSTNWFYLEINKWPNLSKPKIDFVFSLSSHAFFWYIPLRYKPGYALWSSDGITVIFGSFWDYLAAHTFVHPNFLVWPKTFCFGQNIKLDQANIMPLLVCLKMLLGLLIIKLFLVLLCHMLCFCTIIYALEGWLIYVAI